MWMTYYWQMCENIQQTRSVNTKMLVKSVRMWIPYCTVHLVRCLNITLLSRYVNNTKLVRYLWISYCTHLVRCANITQMARFFKPHSWWDMWIPHTARYWNATLLTRMWYRWHTYFLRKSEQIWTTSGLSKPVSKRIVSASFRADISFHKGFPRPVFRSFPPPLLPYRCPSLTVGNFLYTLNAYGLQIVTCIYTYSVCMDLHTYVNVCTVWACV
jgi:hypothetical protein